MKKYTNSELVKRLINVYGKKHSVRVIIAVFCMIILAGLNAVQVQMIEPLLNDAFSADNYSYLIMISVAFLIIGFVRAISIYTQDIFMIRTALFIIKDMQADIYKSLIKSDVSYLEDEGTSKHMSRFTTDLNNIKSVITDLFTSLFKEVFTTIFMLIVMFYNSPKMTFVALFVLPIFFYIVIRLSRRLERIYLENFEQAGLMSGVIDDTLKGIREVKSYNIYDFAIKWIGGHFTKIASLSYKADRTASMARPIMELSISTMISLGLFWGGYMVVRGELTVGSLMAFYVGLITIQRPIKALANLNVIFKSGTASLKRIFDIIDKKPKIKDIKNAKELKVKKGNINFVKVSFAYRGKDYVLNNINLDIKSGSSVALVGESGSGKSSLINLINRFMDATSGKIKIDGLDIKTVSQSSLHKNIAVIGQNPTLFNTTIRENVLFGDMSASDEQIVQALKDASAWEFVSKSKNGLDTLVGERGLQLSGGQRQRIAIARAFLKNAPILILDEATSALDTKSEESVLKTLDKLKKGRTTITIAHRISTIKNADKIYVMDNGEIVESGTHKSLKAKKGIYANLSKDIK